jgi:hypothetical protein
MAEQVIWEGKQYRITADDGPEVLTDRAGTILDFTRTELMFQNGRSRLVIWFTSGEIIQDYPLDPWDKPWVDDEDDETDGDGPTTIPDVFLDLP